MRKESSSRGSTSSVASRFLNFSGPTAAAIFLTAAKQATRTPSLPTRSDSFLHNSTRRPRPSSRTTSSASRLSLHNLEQKHSVLFYWKTLGNRRLIIQFAGWTRQNGQKAINEIDKGDKIHKILTVHITRRMEKSWKLHKIWFPEEMMNLSSVLILCLQIFTSFFAPFVGASVPVYFFSFV